MAGSGGMPARGRRAGFVALGLVGLVGLTVAGAHAQQVEEITVTAQKREESLTRVPVTVNVVTAKVIEDAQVHSSEELTAFVPNLTFRRGTTNVNSSFNIRGIGTISFAAGAEPSVSTVVDGVVFARAGMAVTELYDLERVEVLAGPQGTLFGKNASAGVVNFVTKKPQEEIKGFAEVAYYDEDEVRTRAGVSGALTSTLRGSLTGVYGSYPGNVTNVYNNTRVNGYETEGVRGKLFWDATDQLSVSFIADYVHSGNNCCADVIGDVYAPSAYINQVFLPSQLPNRPNAANFNINNNVQPRTKDTNWGFSIQADYALGDYTLTSITAYRGWRNTEIRDGDFRSNSPTYLVSNQGSDLDSRDAGELSFTQFSEEARIASPKGEFLEYVGGVYYLTTDQDNYFARTVTSCSSSTLAPTAAGTPCAPGFSNYAQVSGPATFNTKFENVSVFGQATANIYENTRLLFGARFSHDNVDYNLNRFVDPTASAAQRSGINPSFASAGSTSNDDVSVRAGLQYDILDNTMAYFTYAQGYKGPAFNVFYNQAATNTAPISPETAEFFELGVKSQLFDRALIVTGSLYRETFDNFQANNFILVGTSVVSTLTNAGTVETQGGEVTFLAAPAEGVSLQGGLTYSDARILAFNCPPGSPATCALNNGTPLPYAPKWKLTLDGAYQLPLPESLPFHVELNSQFQWQTKTQYDIGRQVPQVTQPSYAIWNAGVTFSDQSERYKLSFIVRNLTDQYYTVARIANAGFIRQQVARDAQRYWGFVARANF